ncbi:MAG: methyltransferase domain-containing protein [Proteobacteria bacterium]|nr:methyltransferase domain-containing protein [Pseudomonadota bacterium]
MRPFARYYDVIYGDKDYARDIEAFRQIVAPVISQDLREGALLEIGAGTGNHTQRLAPLVKQLTAVEIDPDFAKLAREKITAAGFSNTEIKTGLLKHASLPAYHLAAAFFHVVNYMQDEGSFLSFLNALRTQLHKGGVFVFDLWHAEGVLTDPPRRETRQKTLDGFKIEQQINPAFDPARQTVQLDYAFAVTSPEGKTVRFTESLKVRLWKQTALESLFAEAGFAPLGCWDYRGFPDPLSETSLRAWAAFKRT